MQGLVLNPQKPRVLLHACCGPCATSCVERLAPDYAVTVYYYNPNITDREEYYLRRDTLKHFIDEFNKENRLCTQWAFSRELMSLRSSSKKQILSEMSRRAANAAIYALP